MTVDTGFTGDTVEIVVEAEGYDTILESNVIVGRRHKEASFLVLQALYNLEHIH